jgi:hypothetical protein
MEKNSTPGVFTALKRRIMCIVFGPGRKGLFYTISREVKAFFIGHISRLRLWSDYVIALISSSPFSFLVSLKAYPHFLFAQPSNETLPKYEEEAKSKRSLARRLSG